ncbi:hypothetical protein BM477_04545 [Boudabousia marimammalium]|uniref:Uncharacterized protein n=2 Tax=Boudabousia marimammalium TaxID=156892 RepID=A0A1Q5PNV8_9ACTO|nr:hypothetical protein BM477_04545 [Boudabousia marimammalium]
MAQLRADRIPHVLTAQTGPILAVPLPAILNYTISEGGGLTVTGQWNRTLHTSHISAARSACAEYNRTHAGPALHPQMDDSGAVNIVGSALGWTVEGVDDDQLRACIHDTANQFIDASNFLDAQFPDNWKEGA